METPADIVILQQQVNKLIGEYQKVLKENIDLKEKNNILADEIRDFKERLGSTESQVQMMKVAQSVSVNSDDTHESRIVINRIVREIDKCIALLNK